MSSWNALADAPLYGALLLTILYVVKFNGWGVARLPGLEDFGWVILFELGLRSLLTHGLVGVAACAVAVLAFFALWLDVVLFRVFTIELGPTGIGTAVTSTLYRELTEMGSARRFFRERLAFTALPAIALVLHCERLFVQASSPVVTALLALYAGWAAFSFTSARGAIFALGLAWAAVRIEAGVLAIFATAAALSWLAVLSSQEPGSRLIRPFLWPRRPPRLAKHPAADDSLPEFRPRLASRSAWHGLLGGQNVLLWTVESMARDYLAAFSSGTARTPFINRLLESGICCEQHFALSSLTNNAHVLLYASSYTEEGGFAPIEALRRTGYRTVYLSSCDTRTYGLRELLERAGFECVLDSAALRNGSRALISDADLLTHGWHHLAPLLTDGRPWFLHVHTNNTHVPYRLSDPASFRHFDSATDLGRFLNGLEEADSHLSQFASKLADLGQTGAPLLVVSADHGQSFGQFGYHSHGSAVVKEQVMVPCVISHPRLKPQAIPYSSHLDVLPTVLDLLGIETARPTFGSSMLGSRARPCWLLWAGHPSRSRTSHFGLVKDQKKYMFDWTVNRGFELAWDDQCARELFGEEKKHYGALISKIARDLGVE